MPNTNSRLKQTFFWSCPSGTYLTNSLPMWTKPWSLPGKDKSQTSFCHQPCPTFSLIALGKLPPPAKQNCILTARQPPDHQKGAPHMKVLLFPHSVPAFVGFAGNSDIHVSTHCEKRKTFIPAHCHSKCQKTRQSEWHLSNFSLASSSIPAI